MSLSSLTAIHTVTIQTQVIAQGRLKDRSVSWGSDRTATCRIQPLASTEVMEFQKRGVSVSHKLYFSEDPEVNELNRFIAPNGDILEYRGHHDTNLLGRLITIVAERKSTRDF